MADGEGASARNLEITECAGIPPPSQYDNFISAVASFLVQQCSTETCVRIYHAGDSISIAYEHALAGNTLSAGMFLLDGVHNADVRNMYDQSPSRSFYEYILLVPTAGAGLCSRATLRRALP